MKTVNLDLVGIDGNAFALMGAFRRQAKKEKWTEKQINKVLTEAKSSDYEHLVYTLSIHCNPEED